MNSNDYAKFAASWSAMTEMQSGRDVSDGVIDMAFNLLIDFEFDELSNALTKHCRSNKWIATPSEIVEMIVGKRPTVESMAGLARNPVTVLGLYLHQLIGSYDMKLLTDEQLIRRVKSHQERIDNFIDRAQLGNIGNSEIRMFAGRQIDPSGDLCRGLRGPVGMARSKVSRRYQDAIVPAIEGAKADAPMTDEQRMKGKNKLAELMATLR